MSRPLMLALFVLCGLPALAAQAGEGPYLFDVSHLSRGMERHTRGRERARLGQPLRQDLRCAGHAVEERGGGAAKPTRSLGCARPMIVVTTSLMSCFRREANALGACLAIAGKRASSANLIPRSKPPVGVARSSGTAVWNEDIVMPPPRMQAMVLDRAGDPLRAAELPLPKPEPDQILIKVAACGVCRTDLHVFDGDLTRPKLPLVLGHEIVGRVEALGDSVRGFAIGERVGVPWLGFTDGTCFYCRSRRENLCDNPRFTGYQIDGGYAEYTLADARYCFPLPAQYGDAEAAPLLCAGLIGHRSLVMTGSARRVGIYGFGAAAHLIAQVARHQGRRVY